MTLLLRPKVAHPDFALPGRQPQGPVKIDWSNPLTKGLQFCVVGSDPKDLVCKSAHEPLGTKKGTTIAGASRVTAGTNTLDRYQGNASIDSMTTGSSFQLVFVPTSWTASGATMSHSNNLGTNTGFSFFESNGTTLDCWRGNDSNFNTTITVSSVLNKVVALGVSFSGTSLLAYRDGSNVATDTSWQVSTGTGYFRIGSSRYVTTQNAHFILSLVWDRYLSPEEHKSLFLNPYQLLRPANDPKFFLPAAAPTTQPSMLRRPKVAHPDFGLLRKQPREKVELESFFSTKNTSVWAPSNLEKYPGSASLKALSVNGASVASGPLGVSGKLAKSSGQYFKVQYGSTGFGGSDLTQGYTFVCRVFGTGTDSSYSNVFNLTTSIQFRHSATDWVFQHRTSGPGGPWNTTTWTNGYANNVEQTLVGIWRPDEVVKLFCNGRFVAASAAAPSNILISDNSNRDLTIGCDQTANNPVSGSYWEGYIALVAIIPFSVGESYGRALSADPYRELFRPAEVPKFFLHTDLPTALPSMLRRPKVAHPDFAIPGRQPSGPVEIDWSNPLTSGLLDVWTPQSLQRATSVLGRKATSSGPVVLVPGGTGGIGACATTASIQFDASVGSSWGEEGTNTVLMVYTSFLVNVASFVSVVRKDGALTPLQISTGNPGIHRTVLWAGGSSLNGTNTDRKTHTLCSVRRSSSTAEFYDNGKLMGSTTALTGYGSTTKGLCFLGTESNLELVNTSTGCLHLTVIWNRALSPAEIASVSQNPYQLLRPVNGPVLFPPAAGEAAQGQTYAISGQAVSTYYGNPTVFTGQGIQMVSSDDIIYPGELDASIVGSGFTGLTQATLSIGGVTVTQNNLSFSTDSLGEFDVVQGNLRYGDNMLFTLN